MQRAQPIPKTLRKRFGQHFLTDKESISAIVQIINPSKGQFFCEIGPGLGALTLPVLKIVSTLHAIEIDRDLIKELKDKCNNIGTLNLHAVDVLKFDFNSIADAHQPMRLIGNLPYNISTPLLFHLLSFSSIVIDLHFMLQKEVVDRIVANPGSSEYSRLSVMVQSHYDAESLLDISPTMFSPPPKVNSSFMRLIPNETYNNKIKDRALFNKIVEIAFNQRRKTIKNSLSSIASKQQLENASIDPTRRPQDISISQYINLSNQLADLKLNTTY
ncbi:MAG: 16S rRNA (adenine(1518)-N(6)/adenine(1519)-N(6))-dimethyltransferase RsmA [Candidatus Neomarinimicrobiota bacterium]